MSTNAITSWSKAPTWFVVLLWGGSAAESLYFGTAVTKVAPSWFEAASSVGGFAEWGWQGVTATVLLALCAAASGGWGLLAWKSRHVLRERM